jgi:hypothetical protein
MQNAFSTFAGLMLKLSSFAFLNTCTCAARAFSFSGLALVFSSSFAIAGPWDFQNDPNRWGPLETKVWSALPLTGKTSHPLWSGFAWHDYEGGLAYRWQNSVYGWNYPIVSSSQAKTLSEEKIKEMSPSEKWDLLNSDYNFTFTKAERSRSKPGQVKWYGLCHGWALAATRFLEPQPTVMTNAEGLKIPFGSADVKAILTFIAGRDSLTKSILIGDRCDSSARNAPGCNDLHPASFHLLLANFVGRKKETFVIDISEGLQIWNKPIDSYTSRVSGKRAGQPGAANGATEELRVETTIRAGHNLNPTWENQPFELRTFVYTYWLEMSPSGEVLGGTWISSNIPDFAWRSSTQNFFEPKFDSSLASAERLYYQSSGDKRSQSPATPNEVFCPADFQKEVVPAVDSPEHSFALCEKNGQVQAPMSQQMKDTCQLAGLGNLCFQSLWPKEKYLSLRGNDRCPRGSTWSGSIDACADDNSALGPFSTGWHEWCLRNAEKNACEKLVWPYDRAAQAADANP